jgi:5-methylcytosine-specific restriction endonuclease McrBC regulatory subunit McrC
MKEFKEQIFREFQFSEDNSENRIIKSTRANVKGKTSVTVEEESEHGIKIVLKKDENDTIKEIKFVCSCGQTKSIILDYSE